MSDRPTPLAPQPGPSEAPAGVRVVVDFETGRIVGAAAELRPLGHAPTPADPPTGETA